MIGGEEGCQLCDAACDLAEGLMLGAARHLRELSMVAEVRRGAQGGGAGEDGKVTLVVRLGTAPVYGEVATRSRIGITVILHEEVTFTIRPPPADAPERPLVLEVEGVEFVELPDITRVRRFLKKHLGSGYCPEACHNWWVENIHDFAPLESSKMHRMIHSIWSMRSFQMATPRDLKVFTIWATVNAVTTRFDAFEFRHEGRAGITVTTRRPAPRSALEAEEEAVCEGILKTTLVRDAAVGEAFAASSFNFMRLLHGPAVGQPGASAAKIIKLLRAADDWGPADSGWQKWDPSWKVTDIKNALGRTIAEQGRLIWGLEPPKASKERAGFKGGQH